VALPSQRGKDVATAAASFASMRSALLTRIMKLNSLETALNLVTGRVSWADVGEGRAGAPDEDYVDGMSDEAVLEFVRRALVASGENRLPRSLQTMRERTPVSCTGPCGMTSLARRRRRIHSALAPRSAGPAHHVPALHRRGI
jgi:hypothetical protein